MKCVVWAVVGAAVVAGAVLGVAALSTPGAKGAALSAQVPPPNTARVEKGQLSATVSLAGALTYGAQPDGSPYTVVNRAKGTYTSLPEPGQVISQGTVLYRVDDHPVVLLRGSTPAYRALVPGEAGADVAQLNADLVTLGYADRAQLDPASASFGPATSAAVKKLQAAVGLARSGALALGQAVFEPSAVRVVALSAGLGAIAQPGQTLMQATSTVRQVLVTLDTSQQTDTAVGDKVSIVLPDNRTTSGVVSWVGTVATCPQATGPGGSATSVVPAVDACSPGGSGNVTPTITVVVTPSDPAGTGAWDQAPVRVSITTTRVAGATAVPVTALLAQPGGGYAVEVVGAAGARHLVAVSLGLFDDADGLVQVSGPGLSAGQRVVVPAI